MHIDGKKLNIRPRLNTRPNGGPRRLSDLALSPNNLSLRPAISRGKSRYDALILSTAHSAKGKEWDAVFVIWAVDGWFPSARCLNSEEETEEVTVSR